MNEAPVQALVSFLRAIAFLALSSPQQEQWLNSLGLPGAAVYADELALEFDDGYLLLPTFVKKGWLPSRMRSHLALIQAALSSLTASQEDEAWTLAALERDPRWEDIRSLARIALRVVR